MDTELRQNRVERTVCMKIEPPPRRQIILNSICDAFIHVFVCVCENVCVCVTQSSRMMHLYLKLEFNFNQTKKVNKMNETNRLNLIELN